MVTNEFEVNLLIYLSLLFTPSLQTGEIAKSDDTKPLVEVGEEEAKKAEGESKEGVMEGAESTDAEVRHYLFNFLNCYYFLSIFCIFIFIYSFI